jgi:hypothetical protein
MAKLKTRIHELHSGLRVSSEGELYRIGEGILELIDWLASVSELSC